MKDYASSIQYTKNTGVQCTANGFQSPNTLVFALFLSKCHIL